jgi:hypothetical protein
MIKTMAKPKTQNKEVWLDAVVDEARAAYPGYNTETCCRMYYTIVKAIYSAGRRPEDYYKLMLLSLFLPEEQREKEIKQVITLN